MCGIVGYTGNEQASRVILRGLARLEYRGYDSAGITVAAGGRLSTCKAPGRLATLASLLDEAPLPGNSGVGHTRWATHGGPTRANAHPHSDCTGSVSLVHNGIIENHFELRTGLTDRGHRFTSETDTEIIAHLIEEELRAGAPRLAVALERARNRVRGSWAVVAMRAEEPGILAAAVQGSPLILGVGDDERILASDLTALLERTKKVVYLQDGDILETSPSDHSWVSGTPRTVETVSWSLSDAEKGGYETFMLKEMHEQPRVIRDCQAGMLSADRLTVVPADPGLASLDFSRFERVYMVACGTAYHSALYGKYLMEELCGTIVEADVASEFRYRSPKLGPTALVVVVSQSGETADTIAALRMARDAGSPVVAVCNVVGSTVYRDADARIMSRAGPEIAVASTKAYLAQLSAMFLLAIHFGTRCNARNQERLASLLKVFLEIPGKVEQALSRHEDARKVARKHCNAPAALYLGRNFNYATALEGALKNKEISYMHSDGYPAGEMKHGPIALIGPELPVICVAPRGRIREKMLSNMQEVRARGGRIIAVITDGDDEAAALAEDVMPIPDVPEELSPFLAVIPLQMFAYEVALALGRDIDKPRNLAKSVTVE